MRAANRKEKSEGRTSGPGTYDFRLWRAKMTYSKGILVRNQSKFAQIAPEGTKKIGTGNFLVFEKQIKKY